MDMDIMDVRGKVERAVDRYFDKDLIVKYQSVILDMIEWLEAEHMDLGEEAKNYIHDSYGLDVDIWEVPARWIETSFEEGHKLKCSNCSVYAIADEPSRYCPNCGRRMIRITKREQR